MQLQLVSGYWLRATTAAVLLLAGSLASGQDGDYLAALPPSDGPLEVLFGFNLVNITDVNEREETMDFDAQIILSWMDPRLAYDPADYGMDPDWQPGDYSRAPRQVYLTNFAVNELFPGWWPTIDIPNGVGGRVVNGVNIGVYPDGRVLYVDSFFTKAETPMDLRRFPFDTQSLDIYLHVLSYGRNEVVLVPSDELSRTWEQNMGLADWSRTGVDIAERPIKLQTFSGGSAEKSEFVVTVHINRKPWHFLTSILFPMILLVALTWCVFWMDKESLSTRVNITFIGILSVVAYYFVVLDSVPEASYLTLVDAFVLATFLMLAASVVLFVVTDSLAQHSEGAVAAKVDRICRWAFPLGYATITLLLAILFLSL